MLDVLLKIVFCSMVIVDDKAFFQSMCKILNIQLHCVAKDNHQAFSVKHFHLYLNKAVTISCND